MNSRVNKHTEHDGYYHLGSIVRTHGVKGNIVIRLDVDNPAAYKKLEAAFLFVKDQLLLHKIDFVSVSADHLIVHFEGIDDMDTAAGFIRVEVYLPVTDLPKLTGKKLYLHEAVGMKVIDANEGELGPIEKIYDLPEQPVGVIMLGDKELLFPMISEFIERVDRVNRVLYVQLPDGLVALYR